jgi:hypothetical protein
LPGGLQERENTLKRREEQLAQVTIKKIKKQNKNE